GIHAQVAGEEAGPNPAVAARACQALEQRLLDRKETSEVRTAAALGLGVSQRAENLGALRAIDPAKEPDVAVAGNLLLARAMLGDPDVPDLADAVLKRKPRNTLA